MAHKTRFHGCYERSAIHNEFVAPPISIADGFEEELEILFSKLPRVVVDAVKERAHQHQAPFFNDSILLIHIGIRLRC